jgi:hypothetical protein
LVERSIKTRFGRTFDQSEEGAASSVVEEGVASSVVEEGVASSVVEEGVLRLSRDPVTVGLSRWGCRGGFETGLRPSSTTEGLGTSSLLNHRRQRF